MTNRKVTLEFDVSDLPLLANSLRTTTCEALISDRPRAKARAEQYRRAIEDLIPEPARVFDGLTWSEICIALEGANSYSVGFEHWGYDFSKESGSRSQGLIFVAIGDRRWSSRDHHILRDDGTIESVRGLVGEMAPLDCVHVPVADTKARHLMPIPTSASVAAPIRYDDDDYDRGWNP